MPRSVKIAETSDLSPGEYQAVEVERSAALPCPPSFVFAYGFESGDTSAWSSQVP